MRRSSSRLRTQVNGAGGNARPRGRTRAARRHQPARSPRGGSYVLITGGAGFIGINLAHRLLQSRQRVLVFDNLSRPGVEKNLRWLCDRHGKRLEARIGDMREPEAVAAAVEKATAVFHLAAQVAVTQSLKDPRHDFDTNALGTLNLLEAARKRKSPPPIFFTSTNKVYGSLKDLRLRRAATRYVAADALIRTHGIGEDQPLDFYSSYGCSKGAADQYVLDYSKVHGLKTVVFRMSCIYGPHQFGNEDQGWVAHFLRQALEGRGVTIYGDGRQVRDILFVDDLVQAMLSAAEAVDSISGEAFNLGGGPGNTISLLELTEMIGTLLGRKPSVEFGPWRPGDQKYYVSNVNKFETRTSWSPSTDVAEGLEKLHYWLAESGWRDRPGLKQARVS